MKNLKYFFESVQGTFFEDVLGIPVELYTPRETGDEVIGPANEFEKKCFSFYFFSMNPDKYNSGFACSIPIASLNARGHTILGFARSLIADRLQLDPETAVRIWVDTDGQIIVKNQLNL